MIDAMTVKMMTAAALAVSGAAAGQYQRDSSLPQ